MLSQLNNTAKSVIPRVPVHNIIIMLSQKKKKSHKIRYPFIIIEARAVISSVHFPYEFNINTIIYNPLFGTIIVPENNTTVERKSCNDTILHFNVPVDPGILSTGFFFFNFFYKFRIHEIIIAVHRPPPTTAACIII